MNTRTHLNKIKKARKMMTPLELKLGVSVWDSKSYLERKQARLAKIIRQHHEEIGRKGGLKTAEKGSEYFKELNKKSLEVRRNKKLNENA